MMESLVFFVLMAAILVIFLDDFNKILKKLMAIRGFSLFVPLLLASWLVVSFETFLSWLLLRIQIVLLNIVSLASFLPFPLEGQWVIAILLLLALTLLPMLGLTIWNERHRFRAISNVWLVGVLVWIFFSTLLCLGLP